MCTHVYTLHWHYYSSLLSTRLSFFLAGWLIPILPVGHSNIRQVFLSPFSLFRSHSPDTGVLCHGFLVFFFFPLKKAVRITTASPWVSILNDNTCLNFWSMLMATTWSNYRTVHTSLTWSTSSIVLTRIFFPTCTDCSHVLTGDLYFFFVWIITSHSGVLSRFIFYERKNSQICNLLPNLVLPRFPAR